MKGFDVLASMGLSFDAWVYSTQLQHLIHWAKAFPETSIVLDHLGTPVELFGTIGAHTGIRKTTRENIQFRWQKDITELICFSKYLHKNIGIIHANLRSRFS